MFKGSVLGLSLVEKFLSCFDGHFFHGLMPTVEAQLSALVTSNPCRALAVSLILKTG